MQSYRLLRVVIIFIILAFLGYLVIYDNFNSQAKMMQDKLKVEYNKIDQFPGAVMQKSNSFRKFNQAIVEVTYLTPSNYTEIRKYYDDELSKNQWKYVKEENVRDWGKDYGGKLVYYKKGKYFLTLQYAGQNVNYGWTFSIDLSWGVH